MRVLKCGRPRSGRLQVKRWPRRSPASRSIRCSCTRPISAAPSDGLVNDYIAQAVSVSKAIEAPVQVIWTREDDTKHDYYRPMSVNALRGVLDAAGNLIALDHTAVAESCVRSLLPQAVQNGVDPVQMD